MEQTKPTTYWKTIQKKVSDFKFHPKNPRIYTEEDIAQLRKDIEEFGYVDEVAVNLDGVLVSGHRRISLFMADGMADQLIDCRIPSRLLSPKEHYRLMVKLNKIGENKWNHDLLTSELSQAELMECGFEEARTVDMVEKEESEPKDKPKHTKTVACPNCSTFFDVEY